jgi:hypothetical protein
MMPVWRVALCSCCDTHETVWYLAGPRQQASHRYRELALEYLASLDEEAAVELARAPDTWWAAGGYYHAFFLDVLDDGSHILTWTDTGGATVTVMLTAVHCEYL